MITDTRPRGNAPGAYDMEKDRKSFEKQKQYPPRMDRDRFGNTFHGSGKSSD